MDNEFSLQEGLRLVSDDAWAASFQTLGQYRSALAEWFAAALRSGAATPPAETEVLSCFVRRPPEAPAAPAAADVRRCNCASFNHPMKENPSYHADHCTFRRECPRSFMPAATPEREETRNRQHYWWGFAAGQIEMARRVGPGTLEQHAPTAIANEARWKAALRAGAATPERPVAPRGMTEQSPGLWTVDKTAEKGAPMALMIDQEDVDRIRRVMRRLFTEDRMDGDAMRDAAQTLEAALRHVTIVPLERMEHDALREARTALRCLMKESAAVIALAEPELRNAIGHTNFSVFRLRVEEAAAALPTAGEETTDGQ